MKEKHSSYHLLLNHPALIEANNIAVFCNYVAFDFNRKTYLIDELMHTGKLSRIFIPEHGLYAAKQDQEKITSSSYNNIPCTSLYQKTDKQTSLIKKSLLNIDVLVIDIPDIGVRYFTYSTHVTQLLAVVANSKSEIPIIIVDRKNPIGEKIEGSVIQENYASLIGMSNLIHRHGLSLGQLCEWYLSTASLSLNLINTSIDHNDYFIPPSPNLPTLNSLLVYPGQCLWEATTFSEGRGTTAPFELFGHPQIPMATVKQIAMLFNDEFSDAAFLRPTKFIPSYHKHKNILCNGWQLTILDQTHYHSIYGSLYIMRQIKEMCSVLNFWLTGTYDYDSDYTAAQTLLGDDLLIDFVNGHRSETEVKHYLDKSEEAWKTATACFKN